MPSIVDKYEQIFAADPRSRIFVELARALLDRGDAGRALEVCRTGLEHHPSSILGRVIWGRALLSQGDLRGAQDQFEIAIALDPASPYAYNLVGEALFTRGHYRDALPVLARAVELQPGDTRLRGWLEEARQKARTASSHGLPAAGPAGPAPAVVAPAPHGAPSGDEDLNEVTEPYRPLVAPAAAARPVVAPTPAAAPLPLAEALTPPASRAPRAIVPAPARAPRTTPAPSSAAALPEPDAGGAPVIAPVLSPAVKAGPDDEVDTAWVALEPEPAAPPAPALHRDEIPRSLLSMIPGATRPGLSAARLPAVAVPDEREAEAIAARYEQEVRERMLAEPEPAPSLLQRHRGAFLALGAVALLAVAGGVYLKVHASVAAKAARAAAGRARAGLARDTMGALREAARVLADTRKAASAPELDSLAAQVAAVLATEYDEAAGGAAGPSEARALAESLSGSPDAGAGGLVARYLLASRPADRTAAETAILNAGLDGAEPMVQALAGRILVRRGEVEGGRGRLEIAARASPPLLRALSDLGDASMSAGDPEGALTSYAMALSAHATHSRSAVGAAEARLVLGRDLERSKAELAAVEADPGSAPPRDLRLRFELATARLLAATGDAHGAAQRLQRAAEKLGETAEVACAAAELDLSTRAWDRAEAAAARAVALAPGDGAARVLLARARIGRGKFAEALAATGNADGNAIRLQRAIVRYRLGQLAEARAELERTWKDGRMPADAAVWYALIDVRLGHADRAQALLEKLPNPPALASVALGRALEAQGKAEEAEAAYRAAVTRDPAAPEGHAALGQFLLARGAPGDAEPELDRAVAADPSDLEVRRSLGAARLTNGKPSLARAELDAVLLAHPADLEALRLLSEAWRAEGQGTEARRTADRGLARAPQHSGLLIAAARAALAQGDRAAAHALAQRAVKAARRGPDADEAKVLFAQARGR
jgi:tetratricopeptide (TPR) repeat protein